MMYCLNFNSPLKKQERDWNTISVSVIVTSDVTMDMSVGRLMTGIPKNSPRSLCESQLGPVPFSFLKWRFGPWKPCCLSKHVFNRYFLENIELKMK